ncbi:MAG: hypothetical protein AB1894_18650 [Chloroflexota bacterium]
MTTKHWQDLSGHAKAYIPPRLERVRLLPEDRAFLRNHPELGDQPAFWDSDAPLSPELEQYLGELIAERRNHHPPGT